MTQMKTNPSEDAGEILQCGVRLAGLILAGISGILLNAVCFVVMLRLTPMHLFGQRLQVVIVLTEFMATFWLGVRCFKFLEPRLMRLLIPARWPRPGDPTLDDTEVPPRSTGWGLTEENYPFLARFPGRGAPVEPPPPVPENFRSEKDRPEEK